MILKQIANKYSQYFKLSFYHNFYDLSVIATPVRRSQKVEPNVAFLLFLFLFF